MCYSGDPTIWANDLSHVIMVVFIDVIGFASKPDTLILGCYNLNMYFASTFYLDNLSFLPFLLLQTCLLVYLDNLMKWLRACLVTKI
jgi:hypothetical protein